jgi:Ca2+-transporting ATPase
VITILSFACVIPLPELLIDPACSIVFEMEPAESDIFRRPPRDVKKHIVSLLDLCIALLQGFIILGCCLAEFWYNATYNQDDFPNDHYSFADQRALYRLNGMVFCTLLIGNLGVIVTNRSKTQTCFAMLCTCNPSLFLIVPTALVLLMLCLYVPGLRTLFHSDVVSVFYAVEAIVAGLACPIIHELLKVPVSD